jgi:RNA recognition motif-containing protein
MSNTSSSSVAFGLTTLKGNLSFRTSDRELVNIFRSFGDVVDCSVPVHRENGKPRGYGFVTLKGVSPKDAIHICR